MATLRRFTADLPWVLLLAPGLASAQRSFSQPELDRLLAPVALYPGPLLSQVLMAATYAADLIEAFLAQEPHVMDTLQQLRRRAHAAAHLRSDDRLLVQPQGQVLAIVPAQPQVVYLPY